MATLHTDSTTSPNPRCLGADGTSLRGTISATYRELHDMFGDQDIHPDEDETQWVVRVEALNNELVAVWTSIREGALAANKDTSIAWNVNAHRSVTDAVKAIETALCRHRTSPTPRRDARRCHANASIGGTRIGVCDRPLDEQFQCDRADDHLPIR